VCLLFLPVFGMTSTVSQPVAAQRIAIAEIADFFAPTLKFTEVERMPECGSTINSVLSAGVSSGWAATKDGGVLMAEVSVLVFRGKPRSLGVP